MNKLPRSGKKLGHESFVCPQCETPAHQKRRDCYTHDISLAQQTGNPYEIMPGITATQCDKCDKFSIWVEGRLVYPIVGDAPLPNKDLPKEIKKDYLEARAILSQSPRSAAALLRLAIDKLCVHLGAGNDKLNNKIGYLVSKGLQQEVQRALDTVRVIGNNAVHPGQIDVDNIDTAKTLFDLVNIITNRMISEGKEISALYEKLPKAEKQQITRRDAKSKGT